MRIPEKRAKEPTRKTVGNSGNGGTHIPFKLSTWCCWANFLGSVNVCGCVCRDLTEFLFILLRLSYYFVQKYYRPGVSHDDDKKKALLCLLTSSPNTRARMFVRVRVSVVCIVFTVAAMYNMTKWIDLKDMCGLRYYCAIFVKTFCERNTHPNISKHLFVNHTVESKRTILFWGLFYFVRYD